MRSPPNQNTRVTAPKKPLGTCRYMCIGDFRPEFGLAHQRRERCQKMAFPNPPVSGKGGGVPVPFANARDPRQAILTSGRM